MRNALIFLVMFILIAPKSRNHLAVWMGDAGVWMKAWAPLSYIIVAVAIIAPLVAAILMFRWPKVVEPERPMAHYKAGEDVIE